MKLLKNLHNSIKKILNFTKFSKSFLFLLTLLFFLFGCSQSEKEGMDYNPELDESNIELTSGSNIYSCSGYTSSKVSALIPFLESGMIQGITCQTCHSDHHSQWNGLTAENHGIFHTPEANCERCHGEDLSVGYPGVNWISCNECHHGTEGMAEGHAGLQCETCHDFSGGGGGGGQDCADCHGDSGSHAIHISNNSRGPNPALTCNSCHDPNNFPAFSDSSTLQETDVCDDCHSPGGSYNGLDDPIIGAKANWESMVYNETGDDLQTGKEHWCVGCHDNQPALINSIYAPGIAGDNINYGFYLNGHGRSGAEIVCLDCHDVNHNHIDGVARTYIAPDISSAVDYYQPGYRLKSPGGESPMVIPYRAADPNGPTISPDAFRLCFSCHDSTPFITKNYLSTNFREDSTSANYHFYHLTSTHNPDIGVGCGEFCHGAHHGNILALPWDSDVDGIGDSDISCTACHNVHGSNSVAMVRTGELIGHEPGLNLIYLDNNPGDPWNLKNPQTLEGSTGSAFDLIEPSTPIATLEDNGICLMCHGQRIDYYRNPTISP